MLQKSYSFKYLDGKKNVFLMTNSNKITKHIRQCEILSERYVSRENIEARNVIVGYVNELLFNDRFNVVKQTTPNVFAYMIELQNLKDHCESINMPLLVYINNYCMINEPREDHYEVYYYYNPDCTSDETIKKFNTNVKKYYL